MLQSVIALALFAAVFVALGIWQVRGQVRYLGLYARKTGRGTSLEEQATAYSSNPLRGWWFSTAATWRGIQATGQRQEDADLERLRQNYLLRRRIWLVVSAVALVGLGLYLNGSN